MCPFYDEIDEILGTRAASAPPTLLESSGILEELDGKLLATDMYIVYRMHN